MPDDKERHERHDIAPPVEPAAPPPEHDEQRGRAASRSPILASSASSKERERDGIERAAAARVEPQVGERRGEIQHAGQRVLELGDPRDRLDVHGVEREQEPASTAPGTASRAQQEGQEKRRQRVETDIDEVIAERVLAPESMEQPERRVDDRVVLLRRADLEPDSAQPVSGYSSGFVMWPSSSHNSPPCHAG